MATLEQDILSRWGGYGNWQSADQNQAADLARLLEANGITDLSRLTFKPRQWQQNSYVPLSEANDGVEYKRNEDGSIALDAEGRQQIADPQSVTRNGFDIFYDGKRFNALGDINRDGSITAKGQRYVGEDPNYTPSESFLGWSARGGGNTTFDLATDPRSGQVVVVPRWGSSSQEDYDTARGMASILALAAGGYFAGAGGTTGAVAQGALQGQGMATAGSMLAGGDVNSLAKASIGGAIGGGITGGINAYGTAQGWNPAVTKAVSTGTNTALRGGDGQDILKAGLLSGAGSLANVPTTSTTTGGSMDFSFDPSLYDNGDFGTVLANTYSDPGAFDFSNIGQYDFGFDPSLFTTDGGKIDFGKMLKSFLGSDLGKLGLAGLAAYDAKDQKQTMTKDPWGPAQPYLKGLMADGAQLYDQYKQNPFSDQQKTAYNNLGGLLNTINANAGGLMAGFNANASGANNFDRSNPRKQLTGSSFDMSQFQPGLFNFFPRG